MGREKKKAKKAAARSHWSVKERLERYLSYAKGQTMTGANPQTVLGMSVFSALVDEANFVCPIRPYCDYEELPVTKKHDNEMLALAEMLATKKEVLAKLNQRADSALRDAMKRGDRLDAARWQMTEDLLDYCKQHYFAGFQRKRTVDKLVKKKLKNYVVFEREVTRRTERLLKEAERSGKLLMEWDARARAVREIV